MRAKLAEKLTWLEKKTKDPASISDARKNPRFVPKASHSTLTLADGTVHECFVIDASLSGVAVTAELQPPIGTPLAIGACIGRVIRHTPDGFAVKFVKQQSRDELNGLIVRDGAGLSDASARMERSAIRDHTERHARISHALHPGYAVDAAALTPPASSAGSGRRRSRPWPPCLPAVSAG